MRSLKRDGLADLKGRLIRCGPLAKEILFWSVMAVAAIMMLPIILLWSLKAWVELG
jgi:hypothetical protein